MRSGAQLFRRARVCGMWEGTAREKAGPRCGAREIGPHPEDTRATGGFKKQVGMLSMELQKDYSGCRVEDGCRGESTELEAKGQLGGQCH